MWFWLALGSAVFGAIEVILSKSLVGKVSPALLSWAFFALTLPILLPLTLYQGIPSINSMFLVGIIGSSVAFVFARTIFNDALRNNLISQILPLTAFSGIFTYLFGLIFLSETLRIIPLLGLFSVIIGSYILNVDQAKEDALKPFKLLFLTRGSLLFLLSVLLGSATVILDKIGVINTTPNNPAFVLFTEQIIMTGLMTAYLIKKENGTWVKQLKQNFRALFIVSFVVLLIGLLVYYAYIDGPAALIIGIKRLQIFFILILSAIIFNDKPTKYSWMATFIMILGVLMIRLG